MNIIKDKDPIGFTDDYDVVLVGTSIYCMLSNGFQSKIRFKYPEVDEANDSTPYGDRRKLGKRLTMDGKPIISLLYIAGYPNSRRDYLDYEALKTSLLTATAEFKGKKVMTTVLGSSKFDGNGDKDKILAIMEECTVGLDIDVYDYYQMSRTEEIREWNRKIYRVKLTDKDKYYALRSKQEEIYKKLYLK